MVRVSTLTPPFPPKEFVPLDIFTENRYLLNANLREYKMRFFIRSACEVVGAAQTSEVSGSEKARQHIRSILSLEKQTDQR